LPVPSHRPKVPTERMADAQAASKRPIYDASSSLVEPAVPAASFGEAPEVGRIDEVQVADAPGPGSYEVKPLVPGNMGAIILPEPPAPEPNASRRERSAPPGPGSYDAAKAVGLVYPSSRSVDFSSREGHSMAFQLQPEYVVQYEDLSPKWSAIRRRSLSAIILPERLRRRVIPGPGPGSYLPRENFFDSDDQILQRLRSDKFVVPWVPLRNGISEHLRGYSDRPVDRALRGDPRPFLSLDGDLATRRRHRAVLVLPEASSVPLRQSWAPGDVWRLYGGDPSPEPEGLADFARRISFEDFPLHEARWRALDERGQKRDMPNLRLAYSLPSLEVTHERPPRPPDFAHYLSRSDDGGWPEDGSPREGDVLLLSLQGERELLHPRSVSLVGMARARGRPEMEPPDEVDDFEELVLTPRHVQRRTPAPVDMARAPARPERPALSANIWADVDGVLYAYQPTAGLQLRSEDDDVLFLAALPGDRLLRRRPPFGDFVRPLGRPGVDPRVPDGAPLPSDESVLLTGWEPRFRAPERPMPPPPPAAPPSAPPSAPSSAPSSTAPSTAPTSQSSAPPTPTDREASAASAAAPTAAFVGGAPTAVPPTPPAAAPEAPPAPATGREAPPSVPQPTPVPPPEAPLQETPDTPVVVVSPAQAPAAAPASAAAPAEVATALAEEGAAA